MTNQKNGCRSSSLVKYLYSFQNYQRNFYSLFQRRLSKYYRGKEFKSTRCKSGVSYILLLISKKGYLCLCLEFKIPIGKQSDEQIAFQYQSKKAGNKYVVIRSAKEAIDILKWYLENGICNKSLSLVYVSLIRFDMIPNKDIENIDDIKKIVNVFYGKVRKDTLIGPIFNEKIQDHWNEHLEKLYLFWQSRLFGDPVYNGFPFPPHAQLPIDKEHFDRWLSIFTETVDNLFAGPIVNEAKSRAYKIAEVFQEKLEYIRKKSGDQ